MSRFFSLHLYGSTTYVRTRVTGGDTPSSRTFGTSGTPLHPEGCSTVRTVQPSLTNLLIVTNFKSLLFHHNMADLCKEAENRIREAIDSISNHKKATISILAKGVNVLAQ